MNIEQIFKSSDEHAKLNKYRPGGTCKFKTMGELQSSPFVDDVVGLNDYIKGLIKNGSIVTVTMSVKQGSKNTVLQFFKLVD